MLLIKSVILLKTLIFEAHIYTHTHNSEKHYTLSCCFWKGNSVLFCSAFQFLLQVLLGNLIFKSHTLVGGGASLGVVSGCQHTTGFPRVLVAFEGHDRLCSNCRETQSPVIRCLDEWNSVV